MSENLRPFPSYHGSSNKVKTTGDTRLRSSSQVSTSAADPVKDHRRRRSSSIISHVEQETFEDEMDQQLLPNMNASWVNQRGAWIIHIVVIVLLKMFYNILPGIDSEWSWTLTNTTYIVGFYVMFHLVKGTPFEFNGGAFDNLTMWEQLDHETLFTPARKFLLAVPIALFLVSTHYADYSLSMFLWNLALTILVGVVPKLAFAHRLRISIPGITRAQIS
ncbi:Protein ORM1 [Nakaseomyces bracarensis]|uniref:Protein ORM1 n=1 Tax=Nakaseomyces bracarensis TaxID=273131 RepID=A0ABR4NUV4_9SACH